MKSKLLGLHLRLSFPVALAAFRRELARVRPRPLDGLELAVSPKPGERAPSNALEVSAILLCVIDCAFPAEIADVPALVMIGCVTPLLSVFPGSIELRNGADPRFAKNRI